MSRRWLLLSFVVTLAARANEAPKTPLAPANALVVRPSTREPPSDCAVPDETLEQRIERLTTALRLSRAELRVRRKAKQ